MRISGMLLTFLLALPLGPAAIGADGDGAAAARLAAENRRLRAELAEARRQIQALQKRLADANAPQAAAGPKADHKLNIRVESGGWGGAGTGDIRKVLLSAASELWKHFPDRRLAPIIVRHSSRGPITLYGRGAGGEYIVKLDVEDTYWCQYAYQFAHEFCHILTNYSEKAPREQQWFCESLCEAASMYAVKEMARSWKTAPPYANWRGYSASLGKYAENIRTKTSDEVPPGKTLGDWFRENEEALRKSPYLRDKNRLVAKHLVRLLEKDPKCWRAVGYMNRSKSDPAKGFAGYLAAWQKDAPAKHKPFVRDVAKLFGIKLAEPAEGR